MKEQKNHYGTLPLNYTVRQALNFIESKVSDSVSEEAEGLHRPHE
jgi:hypothetical protein